MKIKHIHLAAMAIACSAVVAQAKVSSDDLARLGKDLTPMGAEKAGSKDAVIPAWDGGLCKGTRGADPFAAEKPLYTITAANAEQYKAKLSAGHLAMLKKYPDWKMPVYQTHRTFCAPQAIYDAIRNEAAAMELSDNGMTLKGRTNSTTPFPVPKDALEAMYNHTVRNRSPGFERDINWVAVKPNGDSYHMRGREKTVYDQNMDSRSDNRLFSWVGQYFEPATLDGSILLMWSPVSYSAEMQTIWGYNAGLRRVRRLPDANYDFVPEGTEGYRVGDQYDGFNGPTDRYNWKLVGKREVIVPYNNAKPLDAKIKQAGDLLMSKKPIINPDLLRYETHRVWVIEADLKEGQRHVYPKRTFYLDEDSWAVVLEDVYDTRGQLWRLGEHHLTQYADVPIQWYSVNAWYDLSAGAAVIQRDNAASVKFNVKGTKAEFSADNLRRLGTK